MDTIKKKTGKMRGILEHEANMINSVFLKPDFKR